MNTSTCVETNMEENATVLLLFGRVLPYLVRGLLFGGVPPYVLHIADLKTEQFKHNNVYQDTNKEVTWDCLEWMNAEFTYSNYATDIIVFSQCKHGQEETLQKIYDILSLKPSPLARPNVIVIFEMSGGLSSSTIQYQKFIRFIISFKDLQVSTDGSIHLKTQYFLKGNLQPEESIVIQTDDLVKQFPIKEDFNLDFKGELMHVVTSTNIPFVIETGKLNGTALYEGISISVLELLAQIYNFTYDYEEDKVFGKKLENGTWVGTVGQVSKQKKDLAVTGLTISAERSTVVDFTYPYWFEPTGAIMLIKPSKLFYLFKPFTSTLWQAMLGVYILATVCYLILDFMAWRLKEKAKKSCLSNRDIAIWYIARIWLSQSGTVQPDRLSLRFATGIMAFCLVVLCATYSGNLIASLTDQSPDLPLKSIDDLSRSKEYFPILRYGTVHHELFEGSKSGVYARLWKRIQSNAKESLCRVKTILCRKKWLQNSHLVYITDKTGLKAQQLIDSNCEADFIPEDFFPAGFGIAMPLGTPYKPFFDHSIKLMIETGIIKVLEKRYPPNDGRCVRRKQEMTNAQAITLYEVGVAFVLLGIGTAVCMTVLILEILCKRLKL